MSLLQYVACSNLVVTQYLAKTRIASSLFRISCMIFFRLSVHPLCTVMSGEGNKEHKCIFAGNSK